MLAEHNDRRRPDETTVGLQGVKVQRNVVHAGGQNATRRATRQVGIQGVSILHAAAVFLDQLLYRDARRRELDARVFDPATDAETAQALAAVAAKATEPLRALFHNVAHPVQGLEIVLQRGAAKQAYLGNIGWAHAWLTTFALDAFDHGGLFAADVGTCPTAQFNRGQRARRVGLQQGQLRFQNGTAAMVLVTQIHIAGVNTHHLRGNQQALQKTVGIALKVGAVLEGAGLAFVNVDGHQAWRGLVAHDAPFATGRKTGPAQATQARGLHGLNNLLGVVLAINQRGGQGVAAMGAVGVISGIGGRCFHRAWQRRNRLLGKRICYKISSCLRPWVFAYSRIDH